MTQLGDAASMHPCSRSIVSCGCTITASGYYEIDAELSSSQGLTSGGECIAVKAGKVILNLGASEISGPSVSAGMANVAQPAIGIHVQPGSNDIFVEGSGALIHGWSVGLQVEGTDGVFEFFSANDNSVAGIVLTRANRSNVSDFTVRNNGRYGVWLQQSNSLQLSCANADSNASAGIYSGCTSSEAAAFGCKRGATNAGNHLFNLMVNGNGAYGIMFDSATRRSTVSDVSAHDNPSADLVDEGGGCGSNAWFDNSFGSVNQNCVDSMDALISYREACKLRR
jgi:parallel beta-helix repeat protein